MTCQHPKRLKADLGQEACTPGVVLLVVMIDSPESGGWPKVTWIGLKRPSPPNLSRSQAEYEATISESVPEGGHDGRHDRTTAGDAASRAPTAS
jgi:hypothetical protein